MKKISVTWLGDEDPSVQVITHKGHSFVKGEAVTVEADERDAASYEANPMFAVGKEKVDPVPSQEPEPANPEAGTEIDTVRKELDALGVKYDGRSGIDTLRGRLAAEKAKAN